MGGEGGKLQRALVEAAGDLAAVGPNCYGLLNYVDGVAMFASGFGGGRCGDGERGRRGDDDECHDATGGEERPDHGREAT